VLATGLFKGSPFIKSRWISVAGSESFSNVTLKRGVASRKSRVQVFIGKAPEK
jgi:hypothetical protein